MISISFIGIAFVCLASWVLGGLAFLNDRRQSVNRIFATLCLLVGLYTVVNYLTDNDPANGLFWARATFFFATLLVYVIVSFVSRFPRRLISDKQLIISGWISIAVSVVTWLPNFIPSVTIHDNRTDVIGGPLYIIFLVYFVSYFLAVLILISISYRTASVNERLRVGIIFYSLIITTVLVSLTNLFLPAIIGTNQWAQFGSYFVLLFIASGYYAIVRRRLFGFRLVVARGVAYFTLIALMAILYVGIFSAINIFLVTNKSQSAQVTVSTILAVILALTFQPLRSQFERFTNKIFFRNRYDTQKVLAAFSTLLVNEVDIVPLLKHSLYQIGHNLDISYGQLVIFKDGHVSQVEHFGPVPKRLLVAPQLKLLNKAIIVVDELDEGECKDLLISHDLRLSATLNKSGDSIGYLLLGDKLSGDAYTSQDINVIGIMAKELAVAVSNAQAYAEIREFAATLQDRVNHATGRLRVANRHLKELDRVKDEFISMASHQLRTPLTTIKGYLSMLEEGDAGELTPAQLEFINYAFMGSERMVHLISDLLDVSRLSAGRFIIQPKCIDLAKLIQEEVDQLHRNAEMKGLELNLILPEAPLPPLMLDETKTRQVIMNFIDNAIYYTPSGIVTVVLNSKAGVVRFEVRDTGIGVPESAKRHLFTKFFRAENAQNTRPDGTGLGIYLAKRVVEDQGGTIVFSSTEGNGSIFGFELPLVAASESSAK